MRSIGDLQTRDARARTLTDHRAACWRYDAAQRRRQRRRRGQLLAQLRHFERQIVVALGQLELLPVREGSSASAASLPNAPLLRLLDVFRVGHFQHGVGVRQRLVLRLQLVDLREIRQRKRAAVRAEQATLASVFSETSRLSAASSASLSRCTIAARHGGGRSLGAQRCERGVRATHLGVEQQQV